ncbi:MAG TPA: hypothetical protein VIG06_08225 [Kofleriaceae bacterium]|jgi:hypothetical protein
MGLRNKTKSTKKLGVTKETLRALQVRLLDDAELKAVAGGWPTGGCGGTQAPSHCGC